MVFNVRKEYIHPRAVFFGGKVPSDLQEDTYTTTAIIRSIDRFVGPVNAMRSG